MLFTGIPKPSMRCFAVWPAPPSLACALTYIPYVSFCWPAQVVPNFRIRTIPVLGTTPAIFGMAAAAYILTQLAGAPFYSEPIIQLTGLQYDRALQRLVDREEERYGSSEGVAVDRDDVSA